MMLKARLGYQENMSPFLKTYDLVLLFFVYVPSTYHDVKHLHKFIIYVLPCNYMHACMFSRFSCVHLFAILWTVAHQAPLSMGFSRQESWHGLLCPPPEDFPSPGIE